MIEKQICEYCEKIFPVWTESMGSSKINVTYEPDPWEKEKNHDDSNHWLCTNCYNTLAMEI